MSILIELPEDLERALRQQVENLDAAAKELLLINLYREKRIGYGELCRGLGVSRLVAEGILKRHEVYYEMTFEDVVREGKDLEMARNADADSR
ncbi:MAG TPA: UPF0175 family protein [Phycisphaerae bacterium]|nr:UPF0175 family protein [Phycisphaerae bacterium]